MYLVLLVRRFLAPRRNQPGFSAEAVYRHIKAHYFLLNGYKTTRRLRYAMSRSRCIIAANNGSWTPKRGNGDHDHNGSGHPSRHALHPDRKDFPVCSQVGKHLTETSWLPRTRLFDPHAKLPHINFPWCSTSSFTRPP